MKRYKDGLTGWQRYRKRHPERIKEQRRFRYISDPERHKAYSKQWSQRNPDKVAKKYRDWLKLNRPKRNEINLRYSRRHAQEIRIRRKLQYSRHRARIRAYFKRYLPTYRKRQRSLNPVFMLVERMRSRIRAVLAKVPVRKSNRTVELIGCTPDRLRVHLESLFLPGMSWEVRHLIHIDHKRPLASFDLRDPAQQREAFHYTNLQPLWATDNRRKAAKTAAA